ncbi:DUF2138 domain-containing protein [Pseudomonas sp. GCM10022188]|uniref:DUF2138 domain-containing protein n=1 Tax=Pseudomonas TaxID=286 RepID=UPI001E2BA32A|nr:DUF2138 domain-containing protein [Pseudomonas oryzagri]MCC6074735.1 DUF2138 domain-containing protein [Pseudomonas oryzagri]
MNANTSSASARTAAGGKTRARLGGWLIVLSFGLPLAAGALYGWLSRAPAPAAEPAAQNALRLDLRRPDVLIESASLSRLPRDLLAVPLLRDTLTEDFVFYYEQHADRLGLNGSLRRIVYEHELTLQDSLLDELLDQPAQVALWRGADGKLKHFLLVIQRGGLARVLEPLARVASDDSQLRKVGELQVDDTPVALYRLRYNAGRNLLFASHGDQLLVLSGQGLLFDGEDDAARLAHDAATSVEALLEGDSPFAERFGLDARAEASQRITLGAGYLALGYQRFVPAFAGLRFELDGEGWHSYLALDEVDDHAELDFAPVWRAMPLGASACVALPVAPEVAAGMLARTGAAAEAAGSLARQLGGAAGLCWYADSRLHSPLLVAQLRAEPDAASDEQLGQLFGELIGAWESQAAEGIFPVSREKLGAAHRWQREVGSNFGQYPADEAAQPDALAASGFFRVSLARHGSTLLFSLDDRLVDKAIDTLDKRFPPLAEVLPGDALVPAYLAPQALAALLERETLDSLPADMEPVFRNAAQAHLLPKLQALAGHQRYALTLPAGSEADERWQWLPLHWRALE